MSDWFALYGYSEIDDAILLGAYPQDAEDVQTLREARVTRVLNLVQDVEYAEPDGREACQDALAAAGIVEERVEFVDFGNLPSEDLERAVQRALSWVESGQRVYVHCRAGMQRSACVVASVLALRDDVTLLEALGRIRQARPQAEPLVHQREDLVRWWKERRNAAPGSV